MSERIAIFGAGKFGGLAYNEYGERVKYFIDNSQKKIGEMYMGKKVVSLEEYKLDKEQPKILIASKLQKAIENQLLEEGINNYYFFLDSSYEYYHTNELVYNPYKYGNKRDLTEKEWNEELDNEQKIKDMDAEVERLYGKNLLFNHVEIETVNRCNGVCEFCPVSRNNDTREYKVMSDELFTRIINQLAEIDYSGKIALFSNNEPFLDEKIIDRHEYTRKMLPNARMHLFTNGTLLSVEKFRKIMEYLDELIIDNYNQDLKLIKPSKEIKKFCEENPTYKDRVTIVLRKPKEILTSRGGSAPNRQQKKIMKHVKCVLPFKQIIIRPDGKVSLCCNDALGINTLGDLNKENIVDIWNNDRFNMVRKCLYEGRENWQHCKFCDSFNMG